MFSDRCLYIVILWNMKLGCKDDIMAEWHAYIAAEKEKQLEEIISAEHLKEEETRKFISNSFREGMLRTTGTDIDKLMPPVSRFGSGERDVKKRNIISKLQSFFERFYGAG